MAGRVLRPVGVITRTARRLSTANLLGPPPGEGWGRIALDAPPGELKQLADTFDGMLDRIEHLVSAQQRFAANAAHELRTPLAVQRAAAEIGLADPDPANVRRIRGKLIEVGTPRARRRTGPVDRRLHRPRARRHRRRAPQPGRRSDGPGLLPRPAGDLTARGPPSSGPTRLPG
ncbi:histidine kinase dimerization/phospho-acceptor domain-containing protein [Streptomyces sp. NPDC002446]